MKFATLLSVVTVLGTYAAAGPVPRGNDNGHGKDHDDKHNNGHGNSCRGAHCSSESTDTSPANQLWQYSNIAALTEGVASNGTLLENILEHGDLGLGTFQKIAGEMIILDGVIYHATSDAKVSVPDVETTQSPFAAITKFEPTEEVSASFANFSDFTAQLPSWFDSNTANHFVSYRVDGTFSLRIRAPGGQCFVGEPISNVTARQTEWDHENIEGTLVGFRTPSYAANINAAGDHLHFISGDRSVGGHVIQFKSVGEVTVKLAVLDTYTVEVPENDQFNDVDLA